MTPLGDEFKVKINPLWMLGFCWLSSAQWIGIKESGHLKPALLDSGHPRTWLLPSGIVYTIEETDTNGTLMYMGCRFTIYSLFMDIQKFILGYP